MNSFLSEHLNYSTNPNLYLIVNKSNKIEVNDKIIPNPINGMDLIFSSCLDLLFVEDKFLSIFL